MIKSLKAKLGKIRYKKARHIIAKSWSLLASVWLLLTIGVLLYAVISNAKFQDRQIGASLKVYESIWTNECLINTKSGDMIVKDLDWTVEVPAGDSITVFSSHGKRGYVNVNTGKLVTKPLFDKAWTFTDGLGAVSLNDRIMFVNTKGEFAIDGIFMQCGNDVRFMNGRCIVGAISNSGHNYCGIVDTTGKWIVTPEYDKIVPKYPGSNWYEAFSGGRRTDIQLSENGVRLNIFPDKITFANDTIALQTADGTLEYFIRQTPI